ncbi:MAG TPA: hypothetical protein VGL47_41970 [Amycolatopsis sp.]|uniref:Uncharacterized protein n=1 Tax=Amycolatopsis nalaikhensis TaxID=715472 RepID=A0ABY8XES1_9PSEU|nr:hypothetical protein [Amycolatopsis sp. 2-2]WIV54113.1 hypothetical protein QP939_35335 [Amycolatopsis sp. 2-2]
MNATRPGDDRPVDGTTDTGGTVPPRPAAGTDPHPSTPDHAEPGEVSGRVAGAGGRDLPAGYEPL